MKTISLIDRFESFFDKVAGCWEWKGAKFWRGYGQIRVAGKTTYAHRLSYELYHQVAPGSLMVLHTCDNPSCVNPKHLFLGTHKENMQDMVEKKRANGSPGELNAQAKLTQQQADIIRQDSRPQTHIAREYGISQATVSLIKLNKRYV